MALILAANRNDDTANAEKEKISRKVSTIKTKMIQYRPIIFATGKLSSKEEVKLSFKTGGIIKRILVGAGQYVKKGQSRHQFRQCTVGFEYCRKRLPKCKGFVSR